MYSKYVCKHEYLFENTQACRGSRATTQSKSTRHGASVPENVSDGSRGAREYHERAAVIVPGSKRLNALFAFANSINKVC